MSQPDALDTPLARIAEFWNWLPAFRAVAETSHLPSAAQLLGVSAPALSRAVRLLEKNIGVELFWRDGKGMQLTEAGEQFAAALRDGMRRVHDGFLLACGDTMSGIVHVSSEGAVTTVAVAPALLALRSEHPELELSIQSVATRQLAAQLLSGELDVAFHSVRIRGPGVECGLVGELTRGVYCGPDHELAAATDGGHAEFELADLTAYEFVAPPSGKDFEVADLANDGWPSSLERKVALEVDQLRIGAEACQHSDLLAVLPDALMARTASNLRRLTLAAPGIAPETVFASTRTQLGQPSRAQLVRDAVAARIPVD